MRSLFEQLFPQEVSLLPTINPFSFRTDEGCHPPTVLGKKGLDDREDLESELAETLTGGSCETWISKPFLCVLKKILNVFTVEDIQHKIETIKFLEKVLKLTTEEIERALIEKLVQLQAINVI